MRVLLPLGLLALLVLFVAGVAAPRRSKRLQRWMDARLERGEEKSGEHAGRLGDWTAKALELSRRAGDRTVEAGRRLRGRLPS